ncbi:uncharacterized protein LOC132713884 [Ruditapes philippinarum]|uniref:uncharacterized protein LOC132713884 n=1 Tax=Ruditapes philippinarum TaxID=129788 RepID=UPI00295BEB02|nr:uncharacterized protein LOC132713884 [Ruditapes philippinarum]
MSLNVKQNQALNFVGQGHNLLILGSAGTGKSFLINSIVEMCKQLGKTCAVTATTGIACSVYPPQLNPMTIHRWSGIGDGRYGPSEIKRIVSNNVKFTDVLTRVKNTDVLVVDEVSMMSKRFLESLNEVCSLKNETLFFGGLQVILVGDFLQLAPVPCARYNEDGCYCFESDVFNQAFPHVTILTEVVRQNERDMIKAIREISIGVVSDETIKLLKELQRPLQDETIKLFSTNDLVDDYNRDRILDFPGPIHETISIDTGDKKYLKGQTTPRNLWLKIGYPVMLIKNYQIVFDPRKNAVVAVREQYPLKPAYALTIHKSQGMTLERVEVDCRDIFKPGQLGVAMGRACTLEGLRVINFTSKVCIQQPEKILRFVNAEDSLKTEQDRSCCNSFVR